MANQLAIDVVISDFKSNCESLSAQATMINGFQFEFEFNAKAITVSREKVIVINARPDRRH